MWNQNNLSQLSHSGTRAGASNRFSRPRIDIHPTSHFPSTEERKASQLSKQATATPVDTVPFPTVSGSFKRSPKYHRTVAGPKTVVEPASDRHGLSRDHEPHGDKERHRDMHEEDTTGLSKYGSGKDHHSRAKESRTSLSQSLDQNRNIPRPRYHPTMPTMSE